MPLVHHVWSPVQLAVVATPQELQALLGSAAVRPESVGPYRAVCSDTCVVLVSGIGPAAAAAATATALAHAPYDAVMSLGICGAFRGAAGIGDVVVATDLVAADLGADSPEGFLGMGQLGWAEDSWPVEPPVVQGIVDALRSSTSGQDVVTGPVVTVSTASGTTARAALLAERHGAVAEAMEGWGVLTAALPHGVPVLEVRAVSNLVGDRDTRSWDIPAAFAVLEAIGASLLGQPWT